MLAAYEQQSEVARLLSQISAEYEAAGRGLTGLSYGTSQHAFITAHMQAIGQLHDELHSLVGDTAMAMIADRLSSSGSLQTSDREGQRPCGEVYRVPTS